MADAIQQHFWRPATQTYRYLIDDVGTCDAQEALGYAFTLLFGLAEAGQRVALLHRQHRTPQGIPCLWPPFERYSSSDGQSFGRHCGVIWPHIQAFWGQAAAQLGEKELFVSELFSVAEKACRDKQFAEIYHPLTGGIYGGLQEGCPGKPEQHRAWLACARQSWSASGYLRMIFMGLLGMSCDLDGVTFQPLLPPQIRHVVLRNLPYRSMNLTLEIEGPGPDVVACTVNGQILTTPALPVHAQGDQHVRISQGDRNGD